MPLFFMISGFFFASSLRLDIQSFLRKKSIVLLLPCFVWTILYSIINFQDFNTLLIHIIDPRKWSFWFLKELFKVQIVIYLLVRVSERIMGGGNWLLFAVMMSISVYSLPFMSVARVMVPMFWIGYLIHLYYDWFREHYMLIGITALVLYIPLLYFWNSEYMLYYAGFPIKIQDMVCNGNRGFRDFLILIYRICLGGLGSISVIALFHLIQKIPSILSSIGASTMGIYVTQALVLEYLCGAYIPSLTRITDNPYILWLLILGFALWMVFFCYGIYLLIKKQYILSLLLYGQINKRAENRCLL